MAWTGPRARPQPPRCRCARPTARGRCARCTPASSRTAPGPAAARRSTRRQYARTAGASRFGSTFGRCEEAQRAPRPGARWPPRRSHRARGSRVRAARSADADRRLRLPYLRTPAGEVRTRLHRRRRDPWRVTATLPSDLRSTSASLPPACALDELRIDDGDRCPGRGATREPGVAAGAGAVVGLRRCTARGSRLGRPRAVFRGQRARSSTEPPIPVRRIQLRGRARRSRPRPRSPRRHTAEIAGHRAGARFGSPADRRGALRAKRWRGRRPRQGARGSRENRRSTARGLRVPAALDRRSRKTTRVAAAGGEHLPVAAAHRLVGPPAILDKPGLTDRIDSSAHRRRAGARGRAGDGGQQPASLCFERALAHSSCGVSSARRSGTRESGSISTTRIAASGPAAARACSMPSRRGAPRLSLSPSSKSESAPPIAAPHA